MSVKSPYRVHLVLDAGFGELLSELPTDEPVWMVHSPTNDAAARKLCRATASHLDGITLFLPRGSDGEDAFLGVLGTVDLHHGEYSADPPYSLLEVVGCPPSDTIRSALAELGFGISIVTVQGFHARRSISVGN